MLGLRLAIPVFAITTVLVVPLQATTSYYAGGASAETSFNGALGSLTLLNPTLLFSGADLGSGGLFNASGTGIDLLGLDVVNGPLDFTVNTGKLTGKEADERVRINFPVASNIYAFSFHITFVPGSATFGSWCVGATLTGCTYSLINTTAASAQFFGVISDAPITAPLFIRANFGGPIVVLNDFAAYSVPEPHTMFLVGIGLVILSLARRKLQVALPKS